MTICGYNAQIGMGLNLLIEGMATAMQEKAEIAEDAIQALDDEISELDIMIEVMKNKGTVQDMFVGLNILAKYLFLEIRREIINSPNSSIPDLCERIGEAFISTVRDAEEYRKTLDVDNSDNLEIKLVAEWVNNNSNYPNYSHSAK